MNNNNNIVGYDSQTRQPIYANQNNNNNINQNIQNNHGFDLSFQQPIINNQVGNSYNQNNMYQQQPQINNNNYNSNQYTNTNQNIKNKGNKKIIIILGVIALSLILLITSLILIFGNKKSLSRTIMIYMVGSNLESENGLATVDLNSINYKSMDNENINVVLIAGGSTQWNNDYVESNETSIYELRNNGFEKVKTQSLQNMGDYAVFSNFLNYVYDNYKTVEYDLIFWNHGAAILGAEMDEISGDLLTLNDLQNGLSSSKFNNKNKIETVIFRTCLNGTIEVASIFKDYADYFVASEEITRGSQLDNVLSFINEVKAIDNAYDFGIKFIESYKDQMANIKLAYENYYGESANIYSTYSIVDLSKLKDLEYSVNDFFSSIDINSNYNKIAKVRSNLYQYASDDPSYDMVDLYNLVYELKELSPDKADKVLKNIEKTVVYNWATNSKSRGLSIYFPYKADSESKASILRLYDNFSSFEKYDAFISNFNSIQTTSYRDYSFSTNKTDIKSSEEESDFLLELTDEQVSGFAKANYIVFRDNKDGYYLPVYKGNEVSLNGNTLSANIKNKQLKVIATDDSTENILTLFEKEITDDTIEYDTIVTLEDLSSDNFSEWKMETATISLIYNKSTKETKIGGVFLNSKIENSPSGIVAVDLNDYTNVIFASSKYKILDDNGNYNENWESNGVIEGIEAKVGEIDFKQQDFDDGYDYYCVFRIYDVDNNYYYSKLVKMN